LDVRKLVREGKAAEQIIALASGMPCDLIVIGAQHRRFFEDSISGYNHNPRRPACALPCDDRTGRLFVKNEAWNFDLK
jgi:hypothetical protein